MVVDLHVQRGQEGIQVVRHSRSRMPSFHVRINPACRIRSSQGFTRSGVGVANRNQRLATPNADLRDVQFTSRPSVAPDAHYIPTAHYIRCLVATADCISSRQPLEGLSVTALPRSGNGLRIVT